MSEESQLEPTEDGSVMVDIGADMGALVINTGQELAREEIEISPHDPGARRVHVAVRERRARTGAPRYAAVFPSLRAGDYTVWRHKGADEPITTVTITGGSVTEIDWQ